MEHSPSPRPLALQDLTMLSGQPSSEPHFLQQEESYGLGRGPTQHPELCVPVLAVI